MSKWRICNNTDQLIYDVVFALRKAQFLIKSEQHELLFINSHLEENYPDFNFDNLHSELLKITSSQISSSEYKDHISSRIENLNSVIISLTYNANLEESIAHIINGNIAELEFDNTIQESLPKIGSYWGSSQVAEYSALLLLINSVVTGKSIHNIACEYKNLFDQVIVMQNKQNYFLEESNHHYFYFPKSYYELGLISGSSITTMNRIRKIYDTRDAYFVEDPKKTVGDNCVIGGENYLYLGKQENNDVLIKYEPKKHSINGFGYRLINVDANLSFQAELNADIPREYSSWQDMPNLLASTDEEVEDIHFSLSSDSYASDDDFLLGVSV